LAIWLLAMRRASSIASTLAMWRSRASFYYFFMVFVVIRYKTKATAGRALAFIVRVFVNDTIAIAVWTRFRAIAVWISFHVCLCVPLSTRR
jgi:hypothetical protein